MEIYKEDTLVLRFSNTTELNEPKVIRSIFNKVEGITKKAGFKRDFSDNEIDLIRSISASINLPMDNDTTIQVL